MYNILCMRSEREHSLHPLQQSSVAALQAAAVPDLSKKRKAESCAADTAEPETKRGKTLYETTIAAPFRRARRSLGCMHKVYQSHTELCEGPLVLSCKSVPQEHG